MSQTQPLVPHLTTFSDRMSLSSWGHGSARTFGFAFSFFSFISNHIWNLRLISLDSGMWSLLLSDGRKEAIDRLCYVLIVNSQKKKICHVWNTQTSRVKKKNPQFSTYIPHSKNSVLTKTCNIGVKVVKCLLKYHSLSVFHFALSQFPETSWFC